jgi:hypothetical protein
LEVFQRHGESLPQGSPSEGIRILDFTRDGDDWILTVEGDGGGEGEVYLQGDAVETVDNEEGVKSGPVRVLGLEEPGLAILRLEFPPSTPRVTRTVRLRPAGLWP